jgi:hypothetical protein
MDSKFDCIKCGKTYKSQKTLDNHNKSCKASDKNVKNKVEQKQPVNEEDDSEVIHIRLPDDVFEELCKESDSFTHDELKHKYIEQKYFISMQQTKIEKYQDILQEALGALILSRRNINKGLFSILGDNLSKIE